MAAIIFNTLTLKTKNIFYSVILCCPAILVSATEYNRNLVDSHAWFIAGPTLETTQQLNQYRAQYQSIDITATKNPVGEIELNLMVSPSGSNDGPPTDINTHSPGIAITYQSSQAISLQAREGNRQGDGCIHGGSHPHVGLAASPLAFSTVKILWKEFTFNSDIHVQHLNIHNLCKFNFVIYNPLPGANIKIKSLILLQKNLHTANTNISTQLNANITPLQAVETR